MGSLQGPVHTFLSLEGDRTTFPAEILLEDIPPLGTPPPAAAPSDAHHSELPWPAWVWVMPRRYRWDGSNQTVPIHCPSTACQAFHNQDLQGQLVMVI